MDKNTRIILRRSGTVLLVVGMLASLGVYFGNGWFHGELLPLLGVSQATGDAAGVFFILFVAYCGQHLVSLVFYRDVDFGLLKTTQKLHQDNEIIRRELGELDRLANLDKLTGCWNRHRFEEAVKSEIDRLERYDQPLSLLIIDIDHFKQINDRHGHAAGDRVLVDLAGLLRNSLRTIDSLTRWGGEEFIILCPNTTLETAHLLAERLREKVAHTTFAKRGTLTISVGVAECLGKESWQQWLERADGALYTAKNNGRNRVQIAAGTRAAALLRQAADSDFVRIAWRPAYASGNSTIDREHQILFSLANDLLNALISASPTEETRKIIAMLLKEIEQHFASEEAILARTNYPDLVGHAALHRSLLAQAQHLADNFVPEPQAIGALFQYLVHDVIAKHMLDADRAYFNYLSHESTWH